MSAAISEYKEAGEAAFTLAGAVYTSLAGIAEDTRTSQAKRDTAQAGGEGHREGRQGGGDRMVERTYPGSRATHCVRL